MIIFSVLPTFFICCIVFMLKYSFRGFMVPIIQPPQTSVAFIYQGPVFYQNKGDLKMFDSHKIWSDFENISKIYRESGHIDEISDFLKSELEKSGFNVEQKSDTKTICATRGLNKEQNNAVILQAHMDMVGISADGNSKKPIQFNIKDGWLYANDRTLGADDGIGVAAILAIASDEKFKNYPLEMIITTNEETGMDGARKLTAKDFKGKYLVNLDSEKYGEIIKGCAGIKQFSLNEKIPVEELKETTYKKVSLELNGARGGHSATISENSLIPLTILLKELENENIKIISLSTGERYNAIPRDAKIEFLISADRQKEITAKLINDLTKIKEKNIELNPHFDFSIISEDAKVGTLYISNDFQSKMLKTLADIPTGLLTRFEDKVSPKSSQNLGVLNVNADKFHIEVMGRSANNAEGLEVSQKTAKILSDLFDKKIEVSDSTPMWEPIEKSKLQDVAVKTFQKTQEVQFPVVKIEHGGLESAIFTPVAPHLEQISIGPTLEEPHSIQEKLQIDTVVPFYNWLCEILQNLK